MTDVKKNTKVDLKVKDLEANGDGETEVEEVTPPYLMKRINGLKNVQLKMVHLEAKFYEELHQLECKYAKFYEPLYAKRKEIVVGDYEPTEEESKWALDEAEEEGKDKESEKEDDTTESN
jgi:nucleosome assembly protein 1-like 1